MNIYKFQQISTNFYKYLLISLIFLFLGIVFLFSQKNFSIIPQPTTKAQSSYPQCQQGRITSPCQCGSQIYNAGFCCYHPNANSGIWFDPSYEDILPNGCPTGNFYFVDQNNPNASDENPGTEELPWKTLKKACNTVVAGDTVIVKAGRYFEPNPETATWYRVLNVANSGTSDNPIIFKSHPLHAAVVVSNGWPAWAIYQREYIIVDGFKIEGQFRFQSCNHCTIRNCDISVGWHPEGDPSMNIGLMICVSRCIWT